MTVLFLDIDGVLNRHVRHGNGYCGMCPDCVSQLNRILLAVPDLKLVISSAWRYHVHKGHMTVAGLEQLLLTHGVDCFGRVAGITRADSITYTDDPSADWQDHSAEQWAEWGLKWRVEQIREWAASNGVTEFIVVDDLALEMPELVQTDGDLGLTSYAAEQILERLGVKPVELIEALRGRESTIKQRNRRAGR